MTDAQPEEPWPDVFTLTFRVLADDVPPAVRVRHLLKRALRDWRLKCVGGPTAADDELQRLRQLVADQAEALARADERVAVRPTPPEDDQTECPEIGIIAF